MDWGERFLRFVRPVTLQSPGPRVVHGNHQSTVTRNFANIYGTHCFMARGSSLVQCWSCWKLLGGSEEKGGRAWMIGRVIGCVCGCGGVALEFVECGTSHTPFPSFTARPDQH